MFWIIIIIIIIILIISFTPIEFFVENQENKISEKQQLIDKIMNLNVLIENIEKRKCLNIQSSGICLDYKKHSPVANLYDYSTKELKEMLMNKKIEKNCLYMKYCTTDKHENLNRIANPTEYKNICKNVCSYKNVLRNNKKNDKKENNNEPKKINYIDMCNSICSIVPKYKPEQKLPNNLGYASAIWKELSK